MDRRTSIRALLIISTGVAFLPSCDQEKEKSVSSYKNIQISSAAENVLAQLSETIIPKTDTPGAKDVSAHLFALMMLDDCFDADSQDKFEKGLAGFEELTEKRYNKSFVNCSPAEKKLIVMDLEEKKDLPENTAFFYDTMKRLTIQAYTTSEYYLTKVQVYKLVPGKFYGCVPIKKAS